MAKQMLDILLAEIASEIQEVLRHHRSQEGDESLQKTVVTKVVPFLQTHMKALAESTKGTLINFLDILQNTGRLSVPQLMKILYAVIPHHAMLRQPSCYEKSQNLCAKLVQDLSLQGWADVLLLSFTGLLSCLAEVSLSAEPSEVLCSPGVPNVDSSVISLRGMSDVQQLVPCAFRCASTAAQRGVPSQLHSDLISRAVFLYRVHAGCPAVRSAALDTLKQCLPRHPASTPASASPIPSVMHLCFHILCLEGKPHSSFYLGLHHMEGAQPKQAASPAGNSHSPAAAPPQPAEAEPACFSAEELSAARDILSNCLDRVGEGWASAASWDCVPLLLEAIASDAGRGALPRSGVLMECLGALASAGRVRPDDSADVSRRVVEMFFSESSPPHLTDALLGVIAKGISRVARAALSVSTLEPAEKRQRIAGQKPPSQAPAADSLGANPPSLHHSASSGALGGAAASGGVGVGSTAANPATTTPTGNRVLGAALGDEGFPAAEAIRGSPLLSDLSRRFEGGSLREASLLSLLLLEVFAGGGVSDASAHSAVATSSSSSSSVASPSPIPAPPGSSKVGSKRKGGEGSNASGSASAKLPRPVSAWLTSVFMDASSKLARPLSQHLGGGRASSSSAGAALTSLSDASIVSLAMTFRRMGSAGLIHTAPRQGSSPFSLACALARHLIQKAATSGQCDAQRLEALEAILSDLSLTEGSSVQELPSVYSEGLLLAAPAGDGRSVDLLGTLLSCLAKFLEGTPLPAEQRRQVAEALMSTLKRHGMHAVRRLPAVLLALYSIPPGGPPEAAGPSNNLLCLSPASLSPRQKSQGGAGAAPVASVAAPPFYNRYLLNRSLPSVPFATQQRQGGGGARVAPAAFDEDAMAAELCNAGCFDMSLWRRAAEDAGVPLGNSPDPDTLRFIAALATMSGDELQSPGNLAVVARVFGVGGPPGTLGDLSSQDPAIQSAAQGVVLSLIRREGEDLMRLSAVAEGPVDISQPPQFFLSALQRLLIPEDALSGLAQVLSPQPPQGGSAKRARGSTSRQQQQQRQAKLPSSSQGLVGAKSGLHLLLEHLDIIARRDKGFLDETCSILMAAIARQVSASDSAVGLVIEVLLNVLKPCVIVNGVVSQGGAQGPANCSLSILLARQELKLVESRLRIRVQDVLKENTRILKSLLSELDAYSVGVGSLQAPLFTMLSDYVDLDIESFVAENLGMLLSFVIRESASEKIDPRPQISSLLTCTLPLGAERLATYGINSHVGGVTLDTPALIPDVLVVHTEALLTSIFLDTRTACEFTGERSASVPLATLCDTLTEGPLWEEYFERVKSQLELLHKHGRSMVNKALPHKSAQIAGSIVESSGSNGVFNLGVQRARRALSMLALCHAAAKDFNEGRTQEPFPESAHLVPESQREEMAKERIGAAVFSILDNVGELLTGSTVSVAKAPAAPAPAGGDAAEPSTLHDGEAVTVTTTRSARDAQSMLCLGLRILRGLILLLGGNVSKYANKLTPTLNFHFLRLGTRFAKGDARTRKEVGTLIGETWVSYVTELSEDVLVSNLDAFVIEAVCLRAVSELQAARLLGVLFQRTSSAKKRWAEVMHFLPLPRTAPSFSLIVEDITNSVGVSDRGRCDTKQDLLDRLEEIHQGLCSYSKECRNVSLNSFTEYCTAHWEMVHACLADKEVPAIFLKIVQTLLKMSRDWDADQEMHSRALKSIGLLGAVDPNKMKSVRSSADDSLEDLDDESFAIRLINDYLLKTLQLPWSSGGKTQAHDKAAYAIQELFKFLKERGSTRARSSRKSLSIEDRYPWWVRIKEEGRPILAPYLETKYIIVVTQARDAKEVEFSAGMSFRHWLRAWMLNLISKTQGPRGTMVQSVRNVVKDNIDMALFILPYLVLNVCIHGGDETATQLAREIKAVVEYADVYPGSASEHVQVVCSLIDKLSRWRNEVIVRRNEAMHRRSKDPRASDPSRYSAEEGKARRIGTLLEKVPFSLLARACRVTNPARALFYTELYLRSVKEVKSSAKRPALTQLSQVGGSNSWCASKDLRLYQEVCSRLREPDALLGVQSLRQQNHFHEDMEEQAVDSETIGLWSEAMQRYELLLQWHPQSSTYQERMLECMKSLGQYSVMIAYAETRPHLRPYTVQAAWRLGDWELTETALQDAAAPTPDTAAPSVGAAPWQDKTADFERGIAMALVAMRRGDMDAVRSITEATRDGIHSELAAACLESYDTAYKHVVKLHALTDIERAIDVSSANDTTRERFLHSLAAHTDLTELTPETRDVLLSVRRALSSIFGLHKEAGRTWLQIGRLCRSARLFQVAEGALLRAEWHHSDTRYRPEGLLLQQAKLMYAQGNIHTALQLVADPDAKIEDYESDPSAVRAKMRLKSVNWATEINHLPEQEVIKEYREIAEQKPTESAFLSLAQFMEKMLTVKKQQLALLKRAASGGKTREEVAAAADAMRQAVRTIGEIVLHIRETLRAYATSLTRGHKHLYHALPRLIGMYIMEVSELTQDLEALQRLSEEGHRADEKDSRHRKGVERMEPLSISAMNTIAPLHETMKDGLYQLSTEVLYTSLNTLVPLLTHKSPHVVSILAYQIRRIVKQFPDRACWGLMCFLYSERQERRELVKNEIIRVLELEVNQEPRAKTAMMLIKQCQTATEAINRVAKIKGEKEVVLSKYEFYKKLTKLMPLRLVVPIQLQVTLSLPNEVSVANDSLTLFPATERIQHLECKASVMTSLQAPKKATFMSSRGIERAFLCKANDELRKDHRIMELCHIMNLLLRKHPDTRSRDLRTRTFCVTLTGDRSGMIEWVNNVMPFRSILETQYCRAGVSIDTTSTRAIMKKKEARQITPMQAFTDVSSKFPPILHKWFAEGFPDPTSWFRARNGFARGCAVWSMIGHIVGLGDRHAENILVDTTTGEVVHVDFAVLFDKGLSLAYPEVVRFRLTPNIVDGFGICGLEGVFRKCSELTMAMMRRNKATVMSVMEQFIHDPCMEKSEGIELPNIGRRLDGYFDDPCELLRKKTKRLTGGVQLGVKGQVQRLIANATSTENFAAMYHWWMPWY